MAEGREVHALHPGEDLGQVGMIFGPARRHREAAVAGDDRGDPVQPRRVTDRIPGHLGVVVGVDVDDAGRHDHARGVDGPGGLLTGQAADRADATAGDTDIGMAAGEPGPVNHQTVADDQIKHHVLLYAALGRRLAL